MERFSIKLCLAFTSLLWVFLSSGCGGSTNDEEWMVIAKGEGILFTSEGGSYSWDDGTSILIPQDTIPEDEYVYVNEYEPEAAPVGKKTNSEIMGNLFEISTSSPTIDGQIHLTLPYDVQLLPEGFDENDIVLSYFDEDAQLWVSLPSFVDIERNTVSSSVDHFSFFIPRIFTKNKPPTILNFQFSPVTFAYDCEAYLKDPAGWLAENPNKLVLSVIDPDGSEDIVNPPEVTIRSEYAFAEDIKSEPIQMKKIGHGHYELEWNSYTRSGTAGLWPFSIAFFDNACGNLRKYIADVKVKDSEGNPAEYSTVQDVRYWPIPQITLLNPIFNTVTSTTPTLSWELDWPGTLKQIEYLSITVGKRASFNFPEISEYIPLSSTSSYTYTVPEGVLDVGKRYYWEVTVHTSREPIGSSWNFVRSAKESFITQGDVCVPSPTIGCVQVIVVKKDGGYLEGLEVALQFAKDLENVLWADTSKNGAVSFSLQPNQDYFLWVGGGDTYGAWNGKPCPFSVSADTTLELFIFMEEGQGTVSCLDSPAQESILGGGITSRTDTPLPPTYTLKPPTSTPKPPTSTPKPPTSTPKPPTSTPRPPTSTPKPPEPVSSKLMLTALQDMNCRGGPGLDYLSYTIINKGESYPILARWLNNHWILIGGIQDPTTSTNCCWVGGSYDASYWDIQPIDYGVDRITCDVSKPKPCTNLRGTPVPCE